MNNKMKYRSFIRAGKNKEKKRKIEICEPLRFSLRIHEIAIIYIKKINKNPIPYFSFLPLKKKENKKKETSSSIHVRACSTLEMALHAIGNSISRYTVAYESSANVTAVSRSSNRDCKTKHRREE